MTTEVLAGSVLLPQSYCTKLTPGVLPDYPVLLKQGLQLQICSLKLNPTSSESHIPVPSGPPRQKLFKKNKKQNNAEKYSEKGYHAF